MVPFLVLLHILTLPSLITTGPSNCTQKSLTPTSANPQKTTINGQNDAVAGNSPAHPPPPDHTAALFSLAHSLMTRVANLRASRGDHAGADRARNIAAKMSSRSPLRCCGALREVVKAVQREVVEGELTKDCLELGSNDFRGVLQILKDLGLQYGSAASSKHQEL
ncbi:hypothetical protein ACLB2K_036450 [Fragaria x ananassa]